jgi:hypothetical protein
MTTNTSRMMGRSVRPRMNVMNRRTSSHAVDKCISSFLGAEARIHRRCTESFRQQIRTQRKISQGHKVSMRRFVARRARYATLKRYLEAIAAINAHLVLLLSMIHPKSIRADQSTIVSTHIYERMLSSWPAPRKSDWNCWLKSIASSRCDNRIGLFSSSAIACATDTAFLS